MNHYHHQWRQVLLLLLLLLLLPVKSQTPVMCVTGTFTLHSRAFIECLFNRNVNSTTKRYNFNVVQYKISPSSRTIDSGNYVLLCNWQNEKLECSGSDEYTFNGVVSDRLTLEIPTVAKQHEGRYSCQVIPDENIPVQTCDLLVADNGTGAVYITDSGTGSNHEGAVIALTILLVICILVIILFFVLVMRIRNGPGKAHLREALKTVFKCRRVNAEGLQPVERENTASTSLLDTAVETSRPLPITCDSSTSCFVQTANKSIQIPLELRANSTQTEEIPKPTPAVEKSSTTAQETVEKKPKEERPVEDWTAEDVQECLTAFRVEPYLPLFNRRITGQQLLSLRHKKDVEEWGIKGRFLSGKKAEQLLKLITSLNSQNDARKKQWQAEEEKRQKETAEEQQRELQWKAEEKRRRQAADQQQREQEQQRKTEEERQRRVTEEQQRELQKKAEEDRQRRVAEEQQREQQRKAEEDRLRRVAEEQQREQQRKAEEERLRRVAEEQQREQQRKAAEDKRRVSEERQTQVPRAGMETDRPRSRAPAPPLPHSGPIKPPPRQKDSRLVEDWTADDVRDWLADITLEPYLSLITGTGITGVQLLAISDTKALEEWGVHPQSLVTDKKRDELLKHISLLKSENDKRKNQWKLREEAKGGHGTWKEDRPVEEWTKEDIREWLAEFTLQKYKPLLDKKITGKQLLTIRDKQDLERWGIHAQVSLTDNEAEKLLKHIDDFNKLNLERKKMWGPSEKL